MIAYITARNSSSVFYSLTGLSISEFDQLNRIFSFNLASFPSTGRPHTLCESAHKLFFILFYFRHYPIQDLVAFIMRVDQSQVSRWIQLLSIVLTKTTNGYIKKAKRRINSLARLKNICPEVSVIIDASERPVKTPKYNQERVYSGKKHRHTVKNQIAINSKNKHIIDVSDTSIGKTHDFKILKRSKLKLPKQIPIVVDTGYCSIENLYPDNHIFMPNKASKNFPLTDAQKSQNTIISSVRVAVEHIFALLKHNQILSSEFRGSGKLADLSFKALAGLHNFKMQCRHS
jgi:hypothetical protein